MDKEESRLLKNIAKSPWAHPPRLEYAAWIERQGDKSRSDQAEFLRLDVEHEQLQPVMHGPHDYPADQYDRYSEIRRRLQDLHCSLDPAWLLRVDRDLAIPPEHSPRGKKAARMILDFLLAERLMGTCGCQAFYSPLQWKERGGKYGHDALLILVYDGGDVTTCRTLRRGGTSWLTASRRTLNGMVSSWSHARTGTLRSTTRRTTSHSPSDWGRPFT